MPLKTTGRDVLGRMALAAHGAGAARAAAGARSAPLVVADQCPRGEGYHRHEHDDDTDGFGGHRGGPPFVIFAWCSDHGVPA